MATMRAKPNAALTELLQATGELDRILDGQGLTFDSAPAPAVQQSPQPFYIPKPDWDAEERERLAREREQQRQEREQVVVEELKRIAEDAEQPDPIPAKRKWRP